MGNFKSNSWDTCVPEALVRAAGGQMTDLFGQRLVHRPDPPPPATYLNDCGVIASAAGFDETHCAVCAHMRVNAHALKRLDIWGLKDVTDHSAIERTLQDRNHKLHVGLV